MNNADANAVAIRKVGVYLKDSVYEQLVWAIEPVGRIAFVETEIKSVGVGIQTNRTENFIPWCR